MILISRGRFFHFVLLRLSRFDIMDSAGEAEFERNESTSQLQGHGSLAVQPSRVPVFPINDSGDCNRNAVLPQPGQLPRDELTPEPNGGSKELLSL